MVIHNVTYKISNAIKDRWLDWMKADHIPETMDTGLFHDYRICRLLEQDDSDGPTFTVQYYTDTLENYETYIQEHASRLRQRSYAMFGDQFVAFRTVMQVV
ncbi:DUF4286 family protein [Chitinophaga sedimenti]|uniref:DUF4286 family protein n=1 Tax=Chitinophaga sedimenti TaxID=2033606 RepID=UPI002003469E|nr:DUF4286 family protein [Chitinophaga sedimenti]MCK7558801.1 DUF4286 family protein [Chitinophaga sedimenti]